MSVTSAVAGAVALAAALAAALAVAGGGVAGAQDSSPTETARDPGLVYRRDCAVCHGSDGRGTDRGPTLAGVGAASVDYWVSTGRMPLTDEPARDPATRDLRPLPGVQLFDPDATSHRRAPAYPAATIRALVDYVVDLSPDTGPPVPDVDVAGASIAHGGSLFRLQCAACHAWAGDGGALLRREAPPLHDATPVQVAEAIRVGPGAMPAFGAAALDDRELADVVAYVRYLDHPRDRGGWDLWHLGPVAEGGVAWLIAMTALVLAVRWMGEST